MKVILQLKEWVVGVRGNKPLLCAFWGPSQLFIYFLNIEPSKELRLQCPTEMEREADA